MIHLCEPICKGKSHEKVNSGFITGISLANKKKIIRIHTNKTHVSSLKRILKHDDVNLKNIQYETFTNVKYHTLVGFISGIIKFLFFFKKVAKNKDSDVIFLSYNSYILFIVKTLSSLTPFNQITFHFVLHGSFESIKKNREDTLHLDHKTIPIYKTSNKITFSKITQKIIYYLNLALNKMLPNIFKSIFDSFFSEKKILLWKNSKRFKFISLSHHIPPNASRYIDIKVLNLRTIPLPTNFKNLRKNKKRSDLTFATFGYGNSLYLYNISKKLKEKSTTFPFKIKVIGMDHRGTQEFSFIQIPQKKGVLEREDMEKLVSDVDFLLILYGENRYELSCSGSIFEALSYRKPIIHLSNPCINYFNKETKPIGFKCKSLEEISDLIINISSDREYYKSDIEKFESNIDYFRKKYSISENLNLYNLN